MNQLTTRHATNLIGPEPNNGPLSAIHPETGQVTRIGNTGINNSGFGGMFGASNGVFGSSNDGGFYQFDLKTGAATLISNLQGSTNNDGAKCATSPFEYPVDLVITKDNGTEIFTPGTDTTYTITVTNNGPFGVQNALVNDALPAGITEAHWTCGSPVNGGVCGVASGTDSMDNVPVSLPVGASVTFEMTMSIPADFAEDLVNTATVTSPDSSPDIDPSNNIATDTDIAPQPGLTIKKTGTLDDKDNDGLLDPGETITYTFVVKNTGNVTMSNVTVKDPLLEQAGITVTPEPQTLAPGESATFSATYTPTQAEIDAGKVENTATGTGTPPSGVPVESPPDTTVTLSQPASLTLEKAGRFSDTDANSYASIGDTLTYNFTVINNGGRTVENVWPADNGPTFNGKPAGGTLSRFTPEPVTLAPGQSQEFTATYTLTKQDVENAAGMPDAVVNVATAAGRTMDGEVRSNEANSVITLPSAAPSDITVMKTANLRFIKRGEQAPFTIRVTNNGATRATGLSIIDTMPPGFRYVEGTATVDGVKVTPEIVGRQIRFSGIAVDGKSKIDIRLRLLALSSAGPGEHINRAHAEDNTGKRVSSEARAVVEIVVEPVFDCGEIIGKVFDDRNRNGYQDEGEPGLPGVRIATVKGGLVTTDKYGRFHVACADLPDARSGSNFIMKLDERTLPTGYRVTTENPRVVRLTAGKMTELNFGASVGRVVRLDLSGEAFVAGSEQLQQRWAQGIDQLINVLAQEQSVLRLSYIEPGTDPKLAEARVKRIKKMISEKWRQRQRAYPLEIETRVEVE
ncbi:DUF7507 domain-containing protein [Pseudochrobactrum sp. HB0163]|uniref:DUF7507 domain-containing protein n=1 Tax=Pseudochrobactrum sp. HB0163 TaxID=3450708 RepID=UPI003F6E18A9